MTNKENIIRFYRERELPYGCFSNFSPHGVTESGAYFHTVEHYFQAWKFPGTARFEEIRTVRSPMDAKKMGNLRDVPIRPDWEQVKDEVMYQGLLLKFTAHPDIRAVLLGTGAAYIIEDAKNDYYWGCGADGSGRNMLGRLLVKVREVLAP